MNMTLVTSLIIAPSNLFLFVQSGGVIREDSAYQVAAVPTSMARCPRCRRYTSDSPDCPCPRCQTVLARAQWHVHPHPCHHDNLQIALWPGLSAELTPDNQGSTKTLLSNALRGVTARLSGSYLNDITYIFFSALQLTLTLACSEDGWFTRQAL